MQDAIGLCDAEHLARVPAVRDGISVTDQRALRERGGAGRVEDHPRIVRPHRLRDIVHAPLPRVALRGLAQVAEPETAGMRILAVHDDPLEMWKVLRREVAGLGFEEPGKDRVQRVEIVHGP